MTVSVLEEQVEQAFAGSVRAVIVEFINYALTRVPVDRERLYAIGRTTVSAVAEKAGDYIARYGPQLGKQMAFWDAKGVMVAEISRNYGTGGDGRNRALRISPRDLSLLMNWDPYSRQEWQ